MSAYNCTECQDTGKRILPNGEHSNCLDCSCEATTERAAMDLAAMDYIQAYQGDLQHAPEDVRWFVHQRAGQMEREAQAARIAELERQLEEAEDLIAQTSHGAAERISDLERKVDAHRAEAYGLREAIFPRKIQDSKAWRVVPMSHLGGILQLIDPPPVEVDGQTMVFQNPHAAEVLRKISALVRAMLDEPLPEAATPSAPAIEQQSKINAELLLVARYALEYIDGIPKDIEVDASGFDRDWANSVVGRAKLVSPQAADTDKVREALSNLRARVYEMKEAAYTFGDNSKEVAGIALDGVLDEIDAMAAQAPVREVPGWQPIETAPKDGREILVRYPKQGNVKQIGNFNTIHKHWESKGARMWAVEQQCEWHPLPADLPASNKEQA